MLQIDEEKLKIEIYTGYFSYLSHFIVIWSAVRPLVGGRNEIRSEHIFSLLSVSFDALNSDGLWLGFKLKSLFYEDNLNQCLNFASLSRNNL